MRLQLVFLLLLTVGSVVQSQKFSAANSFLQKCYSNAELYNRFRRPSHSLDSLISVIEKIEEQEFFKTKSPSQIAGYLTTRFRADGIFQNSAKTFKYEEDAIKKNNLINKIIIKFLPENFINWKVDFLTDEDQCALHWMLSSSINMTYRSTDIYKGDYDGSDSAYLTNDYFVQVSREFRTRRPLEDGVINTKFGTVSGGNLFMGIALGNIMPDKKMYLYELLPDLNPFDKIRDIEVPVIETSTLGVDLALASKNDATIKNKPDILGPKGTWNCSYCPTEYELDTFATFATYAQVLGGLDGYILGNETKSLSEGRTLRLSHILRMYYGEGFVKKPHIRACNRLKKLAELLNRNELSQAIKIMNFVIEDGRGTLDDSDNEISLVLNTLKTNFTRKTLDVLESCEEIANKFWINELRLDVLIVLEGNDFSMYQLYEEQANFVGNLINDMDVSENASHVGVYVNIVSLFNALYPLNYTMSKVELQCGLKRKNQESLVSYEKPNFFEILNKMYDLLKKMKYNQDANQIIGTPGKVVVFLWNQNPPDEDRVRREMEKFNRDLQEVTILLVGRDKIKNLIKDENEDYFKYQQGNSMYNEAKALYQRLVKVPMEINIPNCDKVNRRQKTSDFNWFISPNARQNIMLPSHMFNISQSLRITVTSYNGDLIVCKHRDSKRINNLPGLTSSKDCPTLTANSKTVFTFPNPCASKPYYCPAIYLQITANNTAPVSPCRDKECRTFDQIKYNIAVEDAFCAAIYWKMTNCILFLCIVLVFTTNQFNV